MDDKQKALKGLAALDFCSRYPVRGHVWWLIAREEFQGDFPALVRKVGSSKERVLKAVLDLWEAGHIDNLPPGTPDGSVEGTVGGGLIIDGTCVEVH